MLVELPVGESPDGRAHVRIGRTTTDLNWERDILTEPSWAKHRDVQLPIGFTNITITATHPQSRLMTNCSFTVEIIGEFFLGKCVYKCNLMYLCCRGRTTGG